MNIIKRKKQKYIELYNSMKGCGFMDFNTIIKKAKATEYLGHFDIIEQREAIKNLVIFESEADNLEQDIPKPWKVKRKHFDRAKDEAPTLVKINIYNEVADAIDDMIAYDSITDEYIEMLKTYPDHTERLLKAKYDGLNKSISKVKEDKKGKIIPIMDKAKACLEEIGRRLK